MQIVLFRHGVAEDQDAFARTGLPDADRPLTDKGTARTRQAAAGLMTLIGEPDAVVASPYVRARQTADIVAEICEGAGGAPDRELLDAMRPGGDAGEIARWLARRGRSETAVLVGHEPDLSDLMAWFTSGQPDGFARFKKSGACLIELTAVPAQGSGELLWLLPPAILRRLAKD